MYPISLGLLKTPGAMGADIITGEGQGLGMALNFGGPYLGFMATRMAYVRKMPGRIAGRTVDSQGREGFVLTLQAREQHIRREKATSNICTNQGLMALCACVYLSVMGKNGIQQAANLCYQKAHYAADRLNRVSGFKARNTRPFFNEFVLECPIPVQEINDYLLDEHDIIGGYDLGKDYPEMENCMLVWCTETNTRDEVDALADALGEL